MDKKQFIEYISSKIPESAVFKDYEIDFEYEKQAVIPHGTIVPLPDFNININATFVMV